MKKAVIITILILAIALGLFFYINNYSIKKISSDSVGRVFSSTTLAAGETFKIIYHVNLNSSQQFYLFEDAVPSGFEVLDCEHDVNNKIKFIEIQNAQSSVFECSIKASSQTGRYTFKGKYALENSGGTKKIRGESRVSVD